MQKKYPIHWGAEPETQITFKESFAHSRAPALAAVDQSHFISSLCIQFVRQPPLLDVLRRDNKTRNYGFLQLHNSYSHPPKLISDGKSSQEFSRPQNHKTFSFPFLLDSIRHSNSGLV